MHSCVARTTAFVGRIESGRVVTRFPRSNRTNLTGQSLRLESRHRLAAVGQEEETHHQDIAEVDDTVPYLAKLFAVSVVGGAVIKYGSLAMSLPFHPNGFIAVSIIAFPPTCFAVWMLSQSGKQS